MKKKILTSNSIKPNLTTLKGVSSRVILVLKYK